MVQFLWINHHAKPVSLTRLRDEDRKSLRSFVQRQRPPPHNEVKQGFEAPSPSGEIPGGEDGDQFTKQIHGQKHTWNAKQERATMQARWRLNSAKLLPKPRKARVLLEKRTRSFVNPVGTPSLKSRSGESQWRYEPEPRLDCATREDDLNRTDLDLPQYSQNHDRNDLITIQDQSASGRMVLTSHEPPNRIYSSHNRSETEQNQVQYHAYSPLTLLQYGQPDPFASFAIAISSHVNFLMIHCRDIELPSIYRSASNPQGLYTTERWSSVVDSLEHPYTAYAHLTRVAATIPSSSSPESAARDLTAQLRSRAVSLLRRKITELDGIRDYRVFTAIDSMLRAEMYSDNAVEARFHAKILAHMLQNGLVAVAPWQAHEAIYCDYQRAIMSRTHTSFDYQTWVPQHYASTWPQVYATLPPPYNLPGAAKGFDSAALDNPHLQDIFLTIRHLAQVLALNQHNTVFQTPAIRGYIETRGLVAMGQTLTLFLHTTATLARPGTHPIHLRIQLILTLAILHWTRTISKTDSFAIGHQKTVFAANAGILSRMREGVAEYELFASRNDKHRYERCLLWALYVGAWAEEIQRRRLGEDAVRLGEGWCAERLGSYSAEMVLWDWEGVRGVLVGFLHFDGMAPDGSEWVPGILERKMWGELPSGDEPWPAAYERVSDF